VTERRCVDCKHFNLKGSPIGKLGFGLCPLRSMTAGHTFSAVYPRNCDKFVQAPVEQVELRERLLKEEGAL
jgi:hypothetical protein